jgi:hypothetical protein
VFNFHQTTSIFYQNPNGCKGKSAVFGGKSGILATPTKDIGTSANGLSRGHRDFLDADCAGFAD